MPDPVLKDVGGEGAGSSRKSSQAEGAAYISIEVRQRIESLYMRYVWEYRGLVLLVNSLQRVGSRGVSWRAKCILGL